MSSVMVDCLATKIEILHVLFLLLSHQAATLAREMWIKLLVLVSACFDSSHI